MRPRDQVKAVYRFEDDWLWWNRNQLTLAQCRYIIRKACDLYGVHWPAVKQHNTRTLSYSEPDINVISLQAVGPLNKGGKNTAVCMHEAAHHICYWLRGLRIEDHGTTFVGVYLHLLCMANVAPRAALEGQMRYRKLRWIDCPPTRFAKWRK